jgi:phage gp36-like protein
MTYAVQQDLVDRFGNAEILQLTDRNNTGSVDSAVVTRALTDADATINSYLATRYTLPLSSVPTKLVGIASDIARYSLYDDAATPQVTQRYEDAIQFLKDVSNGVASIGIDASSQAPAVAPQVQVQANDRVFSRGSASQGTTGTLDDYAG